MNDQTLCNGCGKKPRVPYASRCRDCRNADKRRARKSKERKAKDKIQWEAWAKTDAGKEKLKEARKATANRNRAFIDNYLRSHPCIDCGEDDPLVLEFDHVEEKIRGVRELMAAGRKRIEEEIDRCVVRCANCHTRRHRLEMHTKHSARDDKR